MVRALGKRSLATVLSAFLDINRVVVGVFLGLLLFWAAFYLTGLAIGYEGDFLASWKRFNPGPPPVAMLFWLATFVGSAAYLYILNRLQEIVRTLRFGSPFVRENADRLTKVAIAVAVAILTEYATTFIIWILKMTVYAGDKSFRVWFDPDIDAWFVTLIVLVLAAVFREGAKMKEEQDLTV